MQIIANTFIACSTYFVLATSFWIIFRIVGFFHLSHGSLFTTGAYAAIATDAAFRATNHLPSLPLLFLSCLIVAAFIAAASGLSIHFLVYEPLRRSRASSMVLLLASFGVLVFLDNVIAIFFGSGLHTLQFAPVGRGWQIPGGAAITTTQIFPLFFALALLAISHVGSRTGLTRILEAVSLDPLGASVVGIDPTRVTRWVVAAGSSLAGIGGMLAALEISVRPTIGFQLLFKAIVASVIGGRKLTGVLLGSLLLSALEQTSDRLLSGSWRDGVAFLLLIVFLMVRGEGMARSSEEVRPD